MSEPVERTATIPLGVVIRKQPGVTRWAKWVWRVTAVLPGAPPAEWRELRREGEAVEYHAATLPLELHRAETEAYRVALANNPPCVWVVMRRAEDPHAKHGIEVVGVTAAAYEAADAIHTSDEMVEPVPMPPALIAWVSDFVGRHAKERPFVKRQHQPAMAGEDEAGPRVRRPGDVYLSPAARRGEKPQ